MLDAMSSARCAVGFGGVFVGIERHVNGLVADGVEHDLEAFAIVEGDRLIQVILFPEGNPATSSDIRIEHALVGTAGRGPEAVETLENFAALGRGQGRRGQPLGLHFQLQFRSRVLDGVVGRVMRTKLSVEVPDDPDANRVSHVDILNNPAWEGRRNRGGWVRRKVTEQSLVVRVSETKSEAECRISSHFKGAVHFSFLALRTLGLAND